ERTYGDCVDDCLEATLARALHTRDGMYKAAAPGLRPTARPSQRAWELGGGC
ncbi:unnamed protein product, partial [Polarella glacialis]